MGLIIGYRERDRQLLKITILFKINKGRKGQVIYWFNWGRRLNKRRNYNQFDENPVKTFEN